MAGISSGEYPFVLTKYSSDRSSASYDILRLYDLKEQKSNKHSTVPFLIIPGPPRAGVIAELYVDPTSRFMLSAAGTRGLGGTCTEALIGYEINVTKN